MRSQTQPFPKNEKSFLFMLPEGGVQQKNYLILNSRRERGMERDIEVDTN